MFFEKRSTTYIKTSPNLKRIRNPDDLIDWGSANVTVFASSASARVAAGFTCRYDFGFGETLLQGMILKGLVVLAQFHTFKDDSNRAPFFVREYYALDHGRF